MNKWIVGALCALLTCHMGHALECYKCDYALCLTQSKTTCEPLQTCITYTIKPGPLTLHKKSCSSPTNCMQPIESTYLGVKVTETPSCCSTDLCNSAAMPSASIVTGIAVLLSWWVARLF